MAWACPSSCSSVTNSSLLVQLLSESRPWRDLGGEFVHLEINGCGGQDLVRHSLAGRGLWPQEDLQ